MTSQLKLISVGVVAADKKPDSKFISVYPTELLPFHEGEITTTHATINRSGVDADGVAYNVTLQKGMTVKAEWINEANRITAPLVKKGEQVELWTLGNTDKYYWKSMGRDDHLRRGEVITWAWNASDSTSDKDIIPDATNHYSATIDTVNGHMSIVTSKDNKEVAAYTIQLNTKSGNLTAKDDLGNTIQLNSKEGIILLNNKDNTSLVLDKKVMRLTAKDSITLKADNVIIEAKQVNVTGNTEFKSDVTFKANVTGPKATFTELDCSTLHGVAIGSYKKN